MPRQLHSTARDRCMCRRGMMRQFTKWLQMEPCRPTLKAWEWRRELHLIRKKIYMSGTAAERFSRLRGTGRFLFSPRLSQASPLTTLRSGRMAICSSAGRVLRVLTIFIELIRTEAYRFFIADWGVRRDWLWT